MLTMYMFASALPAAWWARMRLAGEESGEKVATGTEWGVLVGFVAVLIVGGITAFITGLDG